ncbi:MAG: carbon-nitrogen hydrolase [bacterium]|nr:carbon-nitrogen hydrolase [bacterium]
MAPLAIGLIQTGMSEDRRENSERAGVKIREAAARGARIVCLPELYNTPYFPQAPRGTADHLAESIPGESTAFFAPLAKELGIVLIVPLCEKGSDGRFYNAAAVIDADGRLLESYRKVHIPQDPFFYEQDYFVPGNRGYRTYRTGYADFAVLICYDQWFPEAARHCALEGADLLFYPTAIGWIKDHRAEEGDWHNAWETIQRAHAIANGIHVAAVNRVGEEGRLRFWGNSFVCDSFGNVLDRASDQREEVLVVSVDLARNKAVQEEWGFLRNRRPDTYGRLTVPHEP